MAEYIDRDKVHEQISEWRNNEFVRMTNPYHYLEKRVSSIPTADVIERSKIDKAIKEIESSIESIVGKYDVSTPEHDRPLQILARNEGRQQALEILKKHIEGVRE